MASVEADIDIRIVAASSTVGVDFGNVAAAAVANELEPASGGAIIYTNAPAGQTLDLEACKALCLADVTCVGLRSQQVSPPGCFIYKYIHSGRHMVWDPVGMGESGAYYRVREAVFTITFPRSRMPLGTASGCLVAPTNRDTVVTAQVPAGVLDLATVPVPPQTMTLTVEATSGVLVLGVPELRATPIAIETKVLKTGKRLSEMSRVYASLVPVVAVTALVAKLAHVPKASSAK